MHKQQETSVQCPYCGETIDVLIDDSVPQQNYIEDCQVCCRPINFSVSLNHDGKAAVTISYENE
jgi:C4-type Zn-finger protein